MEYGDFNLFSGLEWFEAASGVEWFLNLAYLGYSIFYLMSIIFLGFKFFQAFYVWLVRSDAAFGHTKQQMFQEIFEPVKGLCYFVVGLTAVKIIAGFFL